MNTFKFFDTKRLVLLALLTAIVIVLQVLGAFIKFNTFSVSLVLIPIAIGSALLGSISGLWLGLVFGVVVLISGDAAPFMAVNPIATVIVVLLKGALAGFAAGELYNLFAKRNKTIAAVAAAIACPIINTGIFILGGYIFFLPTLTEWGIAAGAANVTAFIFLVMVGLNFLLELGISIVLSPTIVRLIQYAQSQKGT